MYSCKLNRDWHSLNDGNIKNIILFKSIPHEHYCSWTIISRCLELNPVDVFQFLQVFEGVIVISFDDLVYVLPKSLLNARVVAYIVDHHHEQMRCCVRSRNQKGAEFIDKVLCSVLKLLSFSFPFILFPLLVKWFHQISFHFWAFSFSDLFIPLLYERACKAS